MSSTRQKINLCKSRNPRLSIADSLGFLFFEDVAVVLVRFNFPLLEKKVEIASVHLFENF